MMSEKFTGRQKGPNSMLSQWDDLKYLLALEQNGNLVNAAKALNTNPTTVSRHIKRLSETYKRTLVSRTSNGEWELTEQGQNFARVARVCQEEISLLGGHNKFHERRQITVATVHFVAENFLAPSTSELPTHGKKIALCLETTDTNISLAYGEADLAIRLSRPKQGRLVAAKIGKVNMGIYVSERIFGNAWIGLPSELDWVPEMKAGFEHFGGPPTIRMPTYHCIRRVAIERGLPCVGPSSIMENFEGLRKVNTNRLQPVREVWSVYHEDRRYDELLLKVRDWARDCFAKQIEAAAA